MTKLKYVKKLWHELSDEQREEFTRQLKFGGDLDESNYSNHLYQIQEGATIKEICRGWIINGKNLKK